MLKRAARWADTVGGRIRNSENAGAERTAVVAMCAEDIVAIAIVAGDRTRGNHGEIASFTVYGMRARSDQILSSETEGIR